MATWVKRWFSQMGFAIKVDGLCVCVCEFADELLLGVLV